MSCRLLALFAIWCAADVVSALGRQNTMKATTSSSWILGWLVEHAPGSYANDARILGKLLTWEHVNVSRTGSICVSKLKVRSESGSDSNVLLEVERVECEVTMLWREPRLALRIALANPSVTIKAYDLVLADTNFRRLRDYLVENLHLLQTMKEASSTKWSLSSLIGVKGLDFIGAATVSVVPSDRLGGEDLRATLNLDWRHDLVPLSQAIDREAADKGYLTLAEVFSLVKADLVLKLRVALKDALLRARSRKGFPSLRSLIAPRLQSAKVGEISIADASDVRRAVESMLTRRISSYLKAATSKLSFSDDAFTQVEKTVSELLSELAEVKQEQQRDPNYP